MSTERPEVQAARPAIVVVDDEPDLRVMLADYLGLQGFAVREAESGGALDARLAEAPADLLILDVNMPGEDGFAIVRRLRAAGSPLGILMLTAAGDVPSRLLGLDGGADDYLAKPVELRELLARVRSLLRRMRAAPAARPGGPPPGGCCGGGWSAGGAVGARPRGPGRGPARLGGGPASAAMSSISTAGAWRGRMGPRSR